MEGDSQQTMKFSKPSCPGFRRVTLISSKLGWMPWCTGGTNASESMGIMWKIICTKAVLLIICVYIIWINLRNERTCYRIYWTTLVYEQRTEVVTLWLLLC
jgi:hypothetical protein